MHNKRQKNQTSICPIVLPKNAQQKKIKINFGKKIFFGPLLLLKEFRADLHMREKGGVTKRGEIYFAELFFTTHFECFVLLEQDHQDQQQQP